MRCLPAILILGLAVDAAAQDTRLFVYVADYQHQLLPGARIEVHLENTDRRCPTRKSRLADDGKHQ